ncbi:glycosyltransferase [Candidatus Micrarchaeota archaeon]|nr:glycosyltransferase [Candidatus Micrarchaeota archaeon]
MRIAYFTDTYLPNVDGVVTSIVNTRARLEAQGHEVFVFTPGSQGDKRLNADPRVLFFRSVALPQYPQYKLALFPYVSAVQSARKVRPDLIHSHAITSMGLAARSTAWQLKVPIVGTFHTMITDGTQYLTKNAWVKRNASKVLWRGISLFYRGFDVVCAPSHATAELLRHHGVQHVRVLPNGVDTARYTPSVDRTVVRKLLGIRPDESVVIVAGRMGFEKNVDVVVKAAKRVLKERPVRFIVTGDGPARSFCEESAVTLGVRKSFEFEGFVNGKALPYYYAAADVLVSASAFETQGLSVLEAMACGTPAVVADALALPEAVDDGKNGLLFRPFDVQDCAAKILDALDQGSAKTAAWRKAARRKAEAFSLDESAEKTLEMYEELV